MLKSSIQNKILNTLPDDRPITSIQIVESVERCPQGFHPISRTHDQDQDADLWREGSFFKRSSARYLCVSKTEGLPDFVVQEIIVLNDKAIPPEGYSLLHRTADSEQKAWRKKQVCYRLVHRRHITVAVTDIIVCSRLKKAPEGFTLAGEINGVTVCYKMGNVQDTQSGEHEQNGATTSPERPPRPYPVSAVYPSLNDGGDHDYEILKPGHAPSRPAPPTPRTAPAPPFVHQNSTHTLSSAHYGLEGVPFVVNPKFCSSASADKFQYPVIKAKTLAQLQREYDYNFAVEQNWQ